MKVEKRYVDVICYNDRYGFLKPMVLVWNEDKKIPILSIKDVKPTVTVQNGGSGLRYTCLFKKDIEKHLYYDRGKWYVEMAEHMI